MLVRHSGEIAGRGNCGLSFFPRDSQILSTGDLASVLLLLCMSRDSFDSGQGLVRGECALA